MSNLMLFALVLPMGNPPAPLGGVFYAVPYDNGFQRLYGFNRGGYFQPVNGVGDFGVRNVVELFWNESTEKVYAMGVSPPNTGGDASFLVAQLDRTDFNGTIVWNIDPPNVSNLTQDPRDGWVYAIRGDQSGVYLSRALIGGGFQDVLTLPNYPAKMVYVDGFLGRHGFLMTMGSNGGQLAIASGPPWTFEVIGGSISAVTSAHMIWDAPTRSLWFVGPNDPHQCPGGLRYWRFDEGTGLPIRELCQALPLVDFNDVIYVPPAQPHCTYTDNDDDRDIDLVDFAEFQNCMTGPCERGVSDPDSGGPCD